MTPDARPLTGPMDRVRRHRVALGIAGLAIAALLIVGWLALPGFWHRHVLQLGATDIHDPGLLDDRISVCGRHWRLDVTGREFTRAQLQATFGDNVVLVDPLPLAPCPTGPCGYNTDAPCNTVVFVRVGDDAYVDYELVGGP
jgi:hypothetical protein